MTQATLSQINEFMDVVVAWMDTVEYVERYFWFGAMYDMVSDRSSRSGSWSSSSSSS